MFCHPTHESNKLYLVFYYDIEPKLNVTLIRLKCENYTLNQYLYQWL